VAVPEAVTDEIREENGLDPEVLELFEELRDE
jgi:hypothetical protein